MLGGFHCGRVQSYRTPQRPLQTVTIVGEGASSDLESDFRSLASLQRLVTDLSHGLDQNQVLFAMFLNPEQGGR